MVQMLVLALCGRDIICFMYIIQISVRSDVHLALNLDFLTVYLSMFPLFVQKNFRFSICADSAAAS